MFTALRSIVLGAALLVPAVAAASPVVQITPHGGSVSGTFIATVGICSPEARSISSYTFFYGGSNVTSQFSGGPAAPPSWCSALSADPTYEEWTAELTVVCGQQTWSAAAIDALNFQGDDSAQLNGSCFGFALNALPKADLSGSLPRVNGAACVSSSGILAIDRARGVLA